MFRPINQPSKSLDERILELEGGQGTEGISKTYVDNTSNYNCTLTTIYYGRETHIAIYYETLTSVTDIPRRELNIQLEYPPRTIMNYIVPVAVSENFQLAGGIKIDENGSVTVFHGTLNSQATTYQGGIIRTSFVYLSDIT